jgi:putative nucleotidyltransferase with HDIG domain
MARKINKLAATVGGVTFRGADPRFPLDPGGHAVANILLVGEDKERTGGVKSLLALDGHRVSISREVSRWRDDERASSPEIVVAAVALPAAVLSLPLGGPRGLQPPILFVHRESDENREPHIDERLVDWITSPFAAEEFLGRVDALVKVRRVVMRQKQGMAGSDEPTAPRGRFRAALNSLLQARVSRHVKPAAPYLEVAARVADWSDRRDGFEPGHAERVTNFAAMIADELGVGDGEAAALLRASMLHDIGKVALPIEVLRQQKPLEESQMRLLRTHAERGAEILRALDPDDTVADTILHHHENIDGSGYHGRAGEQIPRSARILAVAEGFDAMTTSLVRKRLTIDAALGLMRERRGRQWDADCVDALAGLIQPKTRAIALS